MTEELQEESGLEHLSPRDQAQWDTVLALFEYHKSRALSYEEVVKLDNADSSAFEGLKVIICNVAEEIGHVDTLKSISLLEIQNQDNPAVHAVTDSKMIEMILLNPETYKKYWFIFRG